MLAIRTLLNGTREVLIKWADLPDHDNSWEPYDAIQQQFPAFHLEDKVAHMGGVLIGQLPKFIRERRRIDGGKVGHMINPIV